MKMLPLVLFLVSPIIHAADISTALTTDQNVQRLKELVNVNSGSANIKGVTTVQNKIKPWFEELGFNVVMKPNPKGETVSAPMLIATLPGEKPEYITLIMHADTVFEPSSPFQKWEMKNDHLMSGPGVIDDKGGIIVALQALKDYLSAMKAANRKPKYSIQVEVTPNEEVGAEGWEETFSEMSKKSAYALGLEPSLKEGIVEGRKGNVWYEVNVIGKEAHAGVDHASGVNACKILSEKIVQLSKLTDYKRNFTLSVGRIEGGQEKFNIVCGWAKAKIDTRVPSLAVRNEMNKKIEAILKDSGITYKIVDETAPMPTSPASKIYANKYLDLIQKQEGKRPLAYFSGGVGDANHFARDGIIVLDGLGPVGAEMHTPSEHIDLNSIAVRAKVLTEFLISL